MLNIFLAYCGMTKDSPYLALSSTVHAVDKGQRDTLLETRLSGSRIARCI